MMAITALLTFGRVRLADAEIIETQRLVGNWHEYTGHYRLIGLPGRVGADIDLRGSSASEAVAHAYEILSDLSD